MSPPFFLMLDMLSEIKLLSSNTLVFTVLRLVGLVTALLGGALAFAQRDFGRIMGYAVLADVGVALVALGTHTVSGVSAALFVVFLRTFGLGLMSMGLALARTESPDDTFQSLTGLAWRRPWAAVGLIVGTLSLAGVPPLGRLCRTLGGVTTGRRYRSRRIAGTGAEFDRRGGRHAARPAICTPPDGQRAHRAGA